MNKYLIIFSMLLTQFVCGMNKFDNKIVFFKMNSEEFFTSYHNVLVQHFYSHNLKSTDVQDYRFICDNESGLLYETKEWKKKVEQDNLEIEKKNLPLNYTINNHRISFFNRETAKQVDCDLAWQGELNLKEEDSRDLIKRDMENVVAAYRMLMPQ